jgi:hypothetical protein
VVAGIFSEISSNVAITYNYISGDGFNSAGSNLWWGAGILVTDSADVTIAGNSVMYCMNGIGGIQTSRTAPNGQPYLIQNLDVSGNTIAQTTGTAAGIVIAAGFDNSVYTSWNNHFQNNQFDLAYPGSYYYFFWLNGPWTLAAWNTYSSIH